MEAEKIATMLTEHENRIKVNEHRINDLEETTKEIKSLTLSVQSLAQSVEAMAKEQVEYREKQNEIAKKLIEIEHAPIKEKAKKHDDTWEQIWHLILGALVGIFLALIGLKIGGI